MKRLLALLLMFLLPYQMTLAAVMVIDMKTAPAAVQMAGEAPCHHADMAMADDALADGGAAAHGDCGICHFSCCSPLPMSVVLAAALPLAESPVFVPGTLLPAPPAARPERPKWGRLA